MEGASNIVRQMKIQAHDDGIRYLKFTNDLINNPHTNTVKPCSKEEVDSA